MNTLRLLNPFSLAACLMILGASTIAGAQAVRHARMDARAARADLIRLQKDRRRAIKYKNWDKVAQDDRLIANDKLWIRKDQNKVKRAGG